ncbi:MAG: ATP-binding cassette domain-containing protein, partial [Candidatus Devosia symbiotica]|nr:ATP-binding cassette domain-containing protein [Candidatus Devosia symbiotica]
LIGENGARKSTFAKMMTGIYQLDAGKIRVDGQVVTLPTAHSASAVSIIVIYQETALFDEMTVAKNIYLGYAPRNRSRIID